MLSFVLHAGMKVHVANIADFFVMVATVTVETNHYRKLFIDYININTFESFNQLSIKSEQKYCDVFFGTRVDA